MAELTLNAPFIVSQQTWSHWCWAAVAQAVVAFYDQENVSQCDIATAATGRFQLPAVDCCCFNDDNNPCNTRLEIDDVLDRLGGNPRVRSHSGASEAFDASIANLSAEIAANRPVVLRAVLPSGDGHFIGVSGVQIDDGTGAVTALLVSDPATGEAPYWAQLTGESIDLNSQGAVGTCECDYLFFTVA